MTTVKRGAYGASWLVCDDAGKVLKQFGWDDRELADVYCADLNRVTFSANVAPALRDKLAAILQPPTR